jgi:hypothetical protein
MMAFEDKEARKARKKRANFVQLVDHLNMTQRYLV